MNIENFDFSKLTAGVKVTVDQTALIEVFVMVLALIIAFFILKRIMA